MFLEKPKDEDIKNFSKSELFKGLGVSYDHKDHFCCGCCSCSKCQHSFCEDNIKETYSLICAQCKVFEDWGNPIAY